MKNRIKIARRLYGLIWLKVLHPNFRPIVTAILAFCCYSQALPSIIFVYWSMFLVAIAGGLLLSRFVRLIEQAIEPDVD